MFVPRSVAVSKPKRSLSEKSEKPSSKKAVKVTKILEERDKKSHAILKDPSEENETEEFRPKFSASGTHRAEDLLSTSGEIRKEEDVLGDEDEEENVVEKSECQRPPKEGEPVCEVCGKYGAYICDKTEKDVCSLECKQINLEKLKIYSINVTEFGNKECKDTHKEHEPSISGRKTSELHVPENFERWEQISQDFRKKEKGYVGHDEIGRIIENSCDQRFPEKYEPVCVMCGRYGAYICDKTDKDICSIECKKKNLSKNKISNHKNFFASTNESGNSENVDNAESTQPKDQMSPCDFRVFFNDNFIYREHPFIKNFEPAKMDFLREKLEIKVQGANIPSLIMEFHHCGFNAKLSENLRSSNYLIPTPVQMQAIPVGLSGKDLIACAQTGTGKSASFLLPIIQRIAATTSNLERDNRCCQSPLALVLCPTRELCMQLEHQAKSFCQGLRNLRTALIIGGNPLPQQIHRLKQGVQLVIATPGRLHDILMKKADCCNLEYLQMLVLDEVDTMLQLGFQVQVDNILEHVPKLSQKMMFSATIPPSIEKIASRLLQEPIFISVGEPSTPNQSVKQIVLWVEEIAKKKRLFEIINDKRHFYSPAVIFVDSKIGADMLSDAVSKMCGVCCASLHGDKLQLDRTHILDEFLNGRYQVLVSTSLLGRGIDLPNVKMVINFDMPSTVEEYIHQVGRAGKLDVKGFAITFINNNNKDVFLKLTEVLQKADIRVPAEIMNLPYLQLQRENRKRKHSKFGARRRGDELVTTGNLMDMLKEYSQKRKR